MASLFINYPTSRNLKKGFTLIELMIVITIVGLLAALGMAAYMQGIDRARIARAQADINRIAKAVQELELDTGFVSNKEQAFDPSDINTCTIAGGISGIYEITLYAFTGNEIDSGLLRNFSEPAPNWRGPYIDRLPLDPWGEPYYYNGQYECDTDEKKGCAGHTNGWENDRVVYSSGKDKIKTTNDDIVYVFCEGPSN